MSSQDNNINLIKQLPFYGKTLKSRVKKLSNLELLRELPFTMILIFQEKNGHLKSIPKPIK